MAILSDSGGADKAEHTTATGFDGSTLTICVWQYCVTGGGTGFARLFCTDEAENSLSLINYGSNTVLALLQPFSVARGDWTVTISNNVWHAFGFTYDRSSSTNDPQYTKDFSSLANMTEAATPSGTFTAPNSGYCIANRSAADRGWDGRLAHFQYFDVILTEGEIFSTLRRPGSVSRGRKLWLPLWDPNHMEDLSGNGWNPTQTGLAAADGPPCAPIWPGLAGWRGAFTAAAPAAVTTRFLTLLGAGT